MTNDLIQAAKDYLAVTDGITEGTEGEWDLTLWGDLMLQKGDEETPLSEADWIALEKTPIARQLILDLCLQLTILSKQMETSVYSLWKDEVAKNAKLKEEVRMLHYTQETSWHERFQNSLLSSLDSLQEVRSEEREEIDALKDRITELEEKERILNNLYQIKGIPALISKHYSKDKQ